MASSVACVADAGLLLADSHRRQLLVRLSESVTQFHIVTSHTQKLPTKCYNSLILIFQLLKKYCYIWNTSYTAFEESVPRPLGSEPHQRMESGISREPLGTSAAYGAGNPRITIS